MTEQALIGIDLGTTHSTLAYLLPGTHEIQQLAIPQMLDKSTQGESFMLPSFLYFTLEGEGQEPISVGTWAKERGAEVPNRVVASAKSWLCHPGVDRRMTFLPLLQEGDQAKTSPVAACTAYLHFLKNAWNAQFPAHPFEQQSILITVPASFDPEARQLVQEAAAQANYPASILIEEPLASFYSWLQRHENEWRSLLKVGDSVLVVDIGGGTTDFSLISVEEDQGDLRLTRKAVGDHLLLGGDNLDLALAYLAKGKFEEKGNTINEWQLHGLIHSCRKVKEELFGDKPAKKVEVTVIGRGSKLVGGTIKTTITQEEAQSLIVEGFLPLISHQETSAHEAPAALQDVGLPYAKDPRITAQLARFLAQGVTGKEGMTLPTAILFNGGTTKALAFRERILAQLNQWATALDKPPIVELEGADYDFSVSRGAVYYGMARVGKKMRIKSGLSRSYFVAVEDNRPAIPGIPKTIQAVCIAPYGMEEGAQGSIHKEFAALLGERVCFRFFSHSGQTLSDHTEATFGSTVREARELVELSPIETLLERQENDGKTIAVKLTSQISELGVLELHCVANDGRSWKLQFETRSRD